MAKKRQFIVTLTEFEAKTLLDLISRGEKDYKLECILKDVGLIKKVSTTLKYIQTISAIRKKLPENLVKTSLIK